MNSWNFESFKPQIKFCYNKQLNVGVHPVKGKKKLLETFCKYFTPQERRIDEFSSQVFANSKEEIIYSINFACFSWKINK